MHCCSASAALRSALCRVMGTLYQTTLRLIIQGQCRRAGTQNPVLRLTGILLAWSVSRLSL